ncbi:hypothetical protein [Luteimonas kalidii]|uniref:Uncharacterized protein n=1 Tax=Luteimonas kalidii TaxID=3042025 RepID=A0ABT6JUV9_9GAMM|nr:hypothetical protein [Luteimonas kalidii]MDH5834476.1 hypothetical protein [Luteimonas kalidii]
MTSIPSPFDALRSLLPLPGRGGPDGNPFGPLADLPDSDDGPPRGPGHHARHGDGPAAPAGGALRADGQAPLSLPEAHQIADVLSGAMRQNPSHPLFRDLPQASPEVFRQWVVDVLTSPQSLMHELPANTVASLAQASSAAAALLRDPGPSASMAQARAEGDAMRATIQAQGQAQSPGQAQAQQGPHAAMDRAQGLARADEARLPAALAQGPGDARGPSDPRSMAGLAQALATSPRAEGAIPPGAPGALPLTAATTASTGAPAQSPSTPAPQGHVAATTADAARPNAEQPVPLLQARAPEAALPARAERAGDVMPAGGLPSLVGAAGVTLAAVAQPAGTTFAHAPQEAVRARTPGERRRARDEAGREEAARETAVGERDGDHDRERRDRGENPTGRSAAAEHSPSSAARHGSTAQPASATAAAAGHTALAGARLPAYGTDEDDEDARPAGHVAAGEDDAAAEDTPAAPRQWLYWSLIAVTYGCLASALGLMTPLGATLPIAGDALPMWRNGLTSVGLASGVWAWVLARRMR